MGKTTLVDEFSKQYDVYIKLNLEQSADAFIFSKTDDVAKSTDTSACRRKSCWTPRSVRFCSSTRFRTNREPWGC